MSKLYILLYCYITLILIIFCNSYTTIFNDFNHLYRKLVKNNSIYIKNKITNSNHEIYKEISDPSYSILHNDNNLPIFQSINNNNNRKVNNKQSYHITMSKYSKNMYSRNTNINDTTIYPFEGLRNDLFNRLLCYKSDFTDGYNRKSISASIFLYFACLAPTIAFGGIANSITNGQMGVVEFILSTGLSGVLYGLFSGQCMTLLGPTGLTLAFIATLYRYTSFHNLPFLQLYSCIGIWTSLFLSILSVFNLSNLMRYCTRFTDDCFNALLSINFMYEAGVSIYNRFLIEESLEKRLVSGFSSFNIAIITWFSARKLVKMKSSKLFNSKIRKFLADFGPSITIITSSILLSINSKIRSSGFISYLTVPPVFSLTAIFKKIPNVFLLDSKLKILSMFPAMLLTLLFYLDHNISIRAAVLLVNSCDLKKGDAYHWDLLTLSVIVLLQSVLGLPWTCAATVQSLNHVRALTTTKNIYSNTSLANNPITSYTSNNQNQINNKPVIISKSTTVIETRITSIIIHSLMLISLQFLPILNNIPISVISGIFIFLGEKMLIGNLFIDRIAELFQEKRLLSDNSIYKQLQSLVIVKYVIIQSIMLGLIWLLKMNKSLSLIFPICIVLLMLIRWTLLPKLFTRDELVKLDPNI